MMIGIIAAMQEEMNAIKNIMQNCEIIKILGLEFYKGNIQNKECILVKCGVGKVNAARTTQILIDKFDIEYIINIGSAGSVNDNVNYGDIVIGQYVVQHDFDITAFGHEKGYISSNLGIKLESDNSLISNCEKAIEKIDNSNFKIVVGTIATGDIFCTSVKMKEKIRQKFEADCVEMEGAAIAQVCVLDEKPFIIIRSISDSPNGNNEVDFNEYLEMASNRCAGFIEELMK